MRNQVLCRKNNAFLHRDLLGGLIACALLLVSPIALAGGIKLPVQNVTNMGMAYAGMASLAVDASTNYYNSAGLTRLCEEQLVIGGTLSLPSTRLTVTNATTTFGTPLSPPTGRAIPANSALVPLLHYAKRINDDWVFGFSSITAFGSRTNYLDNSIVRYNATRSELITVDFSPSLAYNFHNGFSIGAGVNALYATADLYARVGRGNVVTDGRIDNTASRWAAGYHVGILYEFNECTRLGLNYQSKKDIHLKGQSALQFAPGFPVAIQNLKSTINLPDITTLSLYHAFNEQWAIMSDVQYVRWNVFKRLQLNFEDGSTITTNTNYKNAYFVALGGIYQYDNCWQFKLGSAFDKTPTRDGTRQIFNPDQNQIYAAAGVQYRFSQCLAVDFGYIHVFYKKANINLTAPISVGTQQGLQSVQGTARNRMDALGLQFTWDLM